MIVLQVLGVIFVLLIVIIVVGYFVIKSKISRLLQENVQSVPLEVHLNEDVSPSWLNNKSVSEVCSALEQLGFQAGLAYDVYEQPGISLKSYAKDVMFAVVYWHDEIGVWVDLALESEDKEYTFSNVPMGAGIESPPYQVCHKDKSATVFELYEMASTLSASDEIQFKQANLNEFREHFEDAYKRQMAWKNRNGGLSFDEFVAEAKDEQEKELTPELLKEAFLEYKEAELYQWENLVLEAYRKSVKINEDEFYDLKLIIVPSSTCAEAFIQYLNNEGFVNDDQSEKIKKVYSKEKDLFMLFDKLNELLSPTLRAINVWQSDYPLPVKVYKLNDNMV